MNGHCSYMAVHGRSLVVCGSSWRVTCCMWQYMAGHWSYMAAHGDHWLYVASNDPMWQSMAGHCSCVTYINDCMNILMMNDVIFFLFSPMLRHTASDSDLMSWDMVTWRTRMHHIVSILIYLILC